MQSQYCFFFLFLHVWERKRDRENVVDTGKEGGSDKGMKGKGRGREKKNRSSCVSGLRMSCNLMSLDESWLSELTQFFALLVTVLSLMMFAPDYWCHGQRWIAFFWSYVFLCATTLFATRMCRMLNLARTARRLTSPTLCSRHPFKTCLQCLNRRHASIPCSYKHRM